MEKTLLLKKFLIIILKMLLPMTFFINHFENQGKDIRPLLGLTGRDKRYISDNENENILTMGIEASNKVLKKANLTAKNIDLIVFSSDTPEFGYTGTTSPFIALAKALEEGELNRRDIIVFWSVGAGITCSCVLYRY